jgi:arylsulfatase A-like enzyme
VPSTLLLVVRLAAAVTLLLVATYQLLASVPFSFYHFLQFPHFWWMPLFIRLHPAVMAVGVTGLLLTLRDLPSAYGPWVRSTGIAGFALVAWMAVTAWIPALQTYENASALCFGTLVLLGAVGAIDVLAHRDVRPRLAGSAPARPLVGSAALAGALAAAVYLLQHALTRRASLADMQPVEIVGTVAMSLAGHVALFALGAFSIVAVGAFSKWQGWNARVQRMAVLLCASVWLAVLLRRTVLTALTLSEWRAMALACTLGVAIVLYGEAVAARMARTALPSGAPGIARGRWPAAAVSLLMILVCSALLPRLLVLADWGFAIQKLLVFATWISSFILVRSLPEARSVRTAAAGGMAALVAVIATAGSAMAGGPERGDNAHGRQADVMLAIERYAAIDTSVMVLLDLARPVLSEREYFTVLRDTGDVTDNPSLPAVPLRVVDRVEPTTGYKPHIFMIVVDSLRPDYLGAYNPQVTFTPAITTFGRESLVMTRAFTPYTGTALSQPAIWAGGLIQRAMYIKPFSEVNNLERLILANGYRQYISMDEILRVVLGNRSRIKALDSHLTNPERKDQMFKFDLCSTVDELTSRLDRDAQSTAPIFFYSQPQNLHIRVIAEDRFPRYEALRSGGADFFKPAALALQRVDTCFGRLIDHLKARQLYDDSIVVLTSDHGDHYGESGRWGHAFYMTPETLRVPLIVHLPERLRREYQVNSDAVALLTDITPTLYTLLGYQPLPHALLGRSLVTGAGTAAAAPRETMLVQSSYSRVYGLLDGTAKWLYVGNANEAKEQFFEFGGDSTDVKSLDRAERPLYRKALLEALARLNAHYRPEPPSTQ